MKKMLAIISSLTIMASASAAVISCGLEIKQNHLLDLSTLNGDFKWLIDHPTEAEIIEKFNKLNDLELEADVDIVVANLQIDAKTATIESLKGSKKVKKSIEVNWNLRQKINDTEIHLEWVDNHLNETMIKEAVIKQNDGLKEHHLNIEYIEQGHVMVHASDEWHGSVAVKWWLRSTINSTVIDLVVDDKPSDAEIIDRVIKNNLDANLTEKDFVIETRAENQVVVKVINDEWQGTVVVKWTIRTMIDNNPIDFEWVDDKPSDAEIIDKVIKNNLDANLKPNDFVIESRAEKQVVVKVINDKWQGTVVVKWTIRAMINITPIDFTKVDIEPSDAEIIDRVVKNNLDSNLKEKDFVIEMREENHAVVKVINNHWQGRVDITWFVRKTLSEVSINMGLRNNTPSKDEILIRLLKDNDGLSLNDFVISEIGPNEMLVTAQGDWQGSTTITWSIRPKIDETTIDLKTIDTAPTLEEILKMVYEINKDLGLTIEDLKSEVVSDNEVKVIAQGDWQGEVIVKWELWKILDPTTIDKEWLDKEPSDDEIKRYVVEKNDGLTIDDLKISSNENNQAIVVGLNNWKGTVIVKWRLANLDTIFINKNGEQQATSLADLSVLDIQEIVRIGYHKNGNVVQAVKLPNVVKIVPNQISSEITSLKEIFKDATSFNQDISSWDVSNITDMSHMFNYASTFNQNLDSWNVSKVTDMSHMFNYASTFNQNLDSWNVANVTDMSYMFYGATRFDGNIATWNVSKVTDMSHMFAGRNMNSTIMQNVFNQDISQWNVANVTDMSHMFEKNKNFNQDISQWNVANVTDMSGMFWGTTNFNQNLDSWNVGKVTNMRGMFWGATSFNGNLATWNVSKVTNMSRMFYHTSNFNQNISNWKVSNVTDMSDMFSDATSFNQDISKWDVSNVVDMSEMFKDAIAFNANITNWDVSNVTNMSHMFSGTNAFNANITNWDVSNVTSMSGMFLDNITFNQNISTWKVSNVTNMNYMFFGATLFNQDISTWNVSNVTSMSGMFKDAIAFNANITNWRIENVTDMSHMFSGANAFNADITNWDVSNVTDMSGMFRDNITFNQNISTWKVGNVTNMNYMFFGATLFNQDISQWNVSKATDMNHMFTEAINFDQNLSSWDVSRVTNMERMFENATIFNQDISQWNVSKVTNMGSMFNGANAFNQDLSNWDVAKVKNFNNFSSNNRWSLEHRPKFK